MKGSSKIRNHVTSKKRKHGKGSSINLESWDQSDLEDADEKVLEKRLHQLKMQLEMDQDGEREKRLPIKYRKKYSEEASSDSDSSDSSSSLSSASSASVHKYKTKRSSSFSDDDRRKRYSRSRSPIAKKKSSKGSKDSRNRNDNINSKADKRIVFRKKTSPTSEKYSRKKSPLLDRREIYSRVDTGRWHEKAKEFTKERNKREVEHDKPRSHSRTERNRSISLAREQPRVSSRAKDDRAPKKTVGRGATATATRRKESPEPSRTRVSHETARRTALVTRKLSPKDERTGRHDERKLELKVTRRNDVRADSRDVNLRVTRDVRDRKEPVPKLPERARSRELVGSSGKTHRDASDRGSVDRDRTRMNDDRFKDRDKRQQERVVEPERSLRNLSRETEDKFLRRNERAVEVSNRGGGVFDRMRNRYNDRRNAENSQRLNRERERLVVDKEAATPTRLLDLNGTEAKTLRERRALVSQTRIRSPPAPLLPLHRERKEPERSVLEKRSHSPVRFPSPLTTSVRKRNEFDEPRLKCGRGAPLASEACFSAREVETRAFGERPNRENDKIHWNMKNIPTEVRSRSRSSERRRRRSSQEEWRVIDMTSPVLDDEFSDDNIGSFENNTSNKLRRQVANKALHVVKNDELYDSDPSRHKPILTDELSDISDEDFGDINSNNNTFRTKKDLLPRNDRPLKAEQISRNYDQRPLINDCSNVGNRIAGVVEPKKTTNYVDDLIGDQKLPTAVEAVTAGPGERNAEDLDSEEDAVSRVSDALGVDWTDLVEESKRRSPSSLDASYSIRKRWKAINILARVGISEKYAGEELHSEMEKDIVALRKVTDDVASESQTEETDEKLRHKVANLHVSLKDRSLKRRTLFEPYKTAISARKDITLRRRLCGLPVKNLQTQRIIGICHWLV